jgi:murein DD-endopeptidase MepM/ murein hydrolase activator NlpD
LIGFVCNLAVIFKYLLKAASPVGRFLFKKAFLPLYGKYLVVQGKLAKKTSNKRDRLILLFTNKYLIHILILLIGTSVAVSNLSAYEGREDYGQNALIYQLAGLDNVEIIEDTSNVLDESNVYNYQDQGTFIEGNSFAENLGSDSDNVFTDQATVYGDLALIKPDIVTTGGGTVGGGVGKISEYTVEEGDTISKIARKFGVSVNTILWANNLSFSSYVKPGQKLIVPSLSGVIHKVAKGDTLSKIAQKYNVTEGKIREANGLADDTLTAGGILIVPGGTIIETAKPRVVAKAPVVTKKPTPSASEFNDADIPSSGKMLWPSACRRISQYFKGWRHTGVDIACPWGTALRAAAAGTVSRVQYGRTGYGYNVIINHGGGVSTLYGHMSQIDVNVGDYVEAGQLIGAEGSTGRSTGPHVHFEVRIGGSMVNPLSYIR